mmetsp:Transcript_40399/g.160417  ORF Transcript_40399/g.160417 Transcript_40399/m.160417 type:complete len:103 (+) Transcript_40399:839-1147(+)
MASYQAAEAVLANGGKLTLVYYSKHGLKVHLRPDRWTKQNLPVPKPVSAPAKIHKGNTFDSEAPRRSWQRSSEYISRFSGHGSRIVVDSPRLESNFTHSVLC